MTRRKEGQSWSRGRPAPRILLGLTDIAGYYQQLERGLRESGADCTFVNAFPTPFGYTHSYRPGIAQRIVESLGRRHAAAAMGSGARLAWKVLLGAALLAFLLVTLPRFDVYVFASGDSFLFRRDLPLLRRLGKRVIAIFHGSDSRPPYLNAAVVGTSGPCDPMPWIEGSRRVKEKVAAVERNVDVCIQHSMSGHFHERPFINWLEIGIPAPVPAAAETRSRRNAATCVIAHAPTRPGPKGTKLIEAAVRSLQDRGFALELVTIVNRPNRDVLEAIAGSDFVVDELFSDTTLAGFGTEAAALGKPAVVGMYGFDALRRYSSRESIPPAFVCHPFDVESAIETLIRDAALREQLGRDAQRFVRERWSARSVAERFLLVATDEIPAEWWFDPQRIDYVHGWGLTEQRLDEVLTACVDAGGAGVLHVSDKPVLEQALLDRVRRQKHA